MGSSKKRSFAHKMKILVLSNSYYKYRLGGSEIQMKYLVDRLKGNGYNVSYLFINDRGVVKNENGVMLYGIKRRRFAERIFGKIVYYEHVYKKINEIKPDIIYHRNLSLIALPVVRIARSSSIRTILNLARSDELERTWKISIRRKVGGVLELFWRRRLLTSFDIIIAQAEYQRRLLKENFGIDKAYVIRNFHPVPKKRSMKRKPIRVVYVANLKPVKQPDLFVDLAVRLGDRDARFVMIGRDPRDRWSRRLIERISRTENLEYLGELSVDRVNRELEKAHILVNTSVREGFPNTFIQAWMRSVPVVSLNIDPDDIIKTRKIGFHSGTFEKLVEHVETLIDRDRMREEMGQRAYEYAIENHSLRNVEAIVELLR